ncbi:MAG TPA: DUF934 domain-containing protein [Rhodospirillales bacterium]|jgi:uncharacterized protein (DUF934 family)
MPLLKAGEFVADPWVTVDDGAEIPADVPVIVSQERWLERAKELAGRNAPLGIRLKSHQSPATIAEDLHRFSLVALEFPHFKDGRAYSYARLLRERYGFKGEIRAVGNVLRDQHLFMIRCGFDAFELRDGEQPAEWRKHAEAFSVFYQPATDRRTTVLELRHPKAAE